MANQLTRYATVAVVDTAGEGGFFGLTVSYASIGGPTLISDGAERTFVYQFVLPFRATIATVNSEITIAEVGKFYGLGIYDVAGNLVVRTAAIGMDSTGRQETALAASATLEPGVYYFAQTTDGTTGKLRATANNAAEMNIVNQGTENRIGRAGNNGSAGVLAATMGAITASASRSAAMALFKP